MAETSARELTNEFPYSVILYGDQLVLFDMIDQIVGHGPTQIFQAALGRYFAQHGVEFPLAPRRTTGRRKARLRGGRKRPFTTWFTPSQDEIIRRFMEENQIGYSQLIEEALKLYIPEEYGMNWPYMRRYAAGEEQPD